MVLRCCEDDSAGHVFLAKYMPWSSTAFDLLTLGLQLGGLLFDILVASYFYSLPDDEGLVWGRLVISFVAISACVLLFVFHIFVLNDWPGLDHNIHWGWTVLYAPVGFLLPALTTFWDLCYGYGTDSEFMPQVAVRARYETKYTSIQDTNTYTILDNDTYEVPPPPETSVWDEIARGHDLITTTQSRNRYSPIADTYLANDSISKRIDDDLDRQEDLLNPEGGPTMSYGTNKHASSSKSQTLNKDRSGGGNQISVVQNKITEEQIHSLRHTLRLGKFTDNFVRRRFKTHVLYFVTALVDSLPQFLIQLMALSLGVGGGGSWQQYGSLALSALNIVSKGYLICRSLDSQIAIFKLLCIGFDTSSFAFMVNFLAHPEQPIETFALFGFGTPLLTAIWGICLSVVIGMMYIFLIFAFFYECSRHGDKFFLVIPILAILLGAPVTVFAVACKTLWGVLTVFFLEPSNRKWFASMAVAFHFIELPEGDRNAKWFFLLKGIGSGWPLDSENNGWAYIPSSVRIIHEVLAKESKKSTRTENWSISDFRRVANHEDSANPCRGLSGRCRRNRLDSTACLLFILCCSLQCFTVVFPFLAFGIYYNDLYSQNSVSLGCILFYLTCGFLILMIPFLSRVYRYLHFLDIIDTFHSIQYSISDKEVINVPKLAKFFTPPHMAVLRRVLPSRLLPADLSEHLSLFIDQEGVGGQDKNGIDLTGLSMAECEALKLEKESEESGPEEEGDEDYQENTDPGDNANNISKQEKHDGEEEATTDLINDRYLDDVLKNVHMLDDIDRLVEK